MKDSIDLVEHYKARFDFKNAKYVAADPNTCFTLNFNDGKLYNVAGYYRVPLAKSTRASNYQDIPDNSFAFFLFGHSNVTKSDSNNFATWDDLLSKSAFNSDTVNNQYGYIYSINEKGGFNYIPRNIYVNNPGLAIPAVTAGDTLGCTLAEGDIHYRNCPVLPLSLKDNQEFTGPRDHVPSSHSVLLDLQD